MINRYVGLYFIFVLALALGCTRNGHKPQDGQTHWLKTCEKSGECGELECICGYCVQTCDADRACDVEGMTTDCKPVDSKAVEALCQMEEPSEEVCLQPCDSDSECDKGQACIGGACLPVDSESDDAGPPDDAGQPKADAESIDPDRSDSEVDQPPDGLSKDELLGCLNGRISIRQDVNKVDKLDLLFVVDNSQSMEQEQAKLRDQIPRMIKTLTTGDKTPDDVVENKDFPPVEDLHLAVVSTDMGLPGLAPEDNPDSTGACNATGDDGNFLNDPSNAMAAGLDCAVSYPLFLEHIIDSREDQESAIERAQKTADNFACLTTLGTDGCGFEMPLESALKSLWPSQASNLSETHQALNISFLAGSQGRGDGDHRSFLRGTPYHPTESDKLSLLAIIVVTDESDCSAGANGNLDFLSLDFPGGDGDRRDLNLRCYYDTMNNGGNKFPVERYINGFRALRPESPDLVVFSAIAGIPPQIAMDANADGEITADERNDFYDQVLNDPFMQEVPDPETNNLNYVCAHETSSGEFDTKALPARRLTEVAKGFGANGTIRSICSDDFLPAMHSIVDIISDKIGGVCLPSSYERDSEGLIACDMKWTMPPEHTCDDYPYLSAPPASSPQQDDDGRQICVVDQIPVINTDTDDPAEALGFTDDSGNLGWYYDDFSEDMQSVCRTTEIVTTKQRISFTLSPGMGGVNEDPPAGVSISLECWRDPAPDRSTTEEEGEFNGWSCKWDGCSEGDFYCHESANLCVAACQTDADCEANDLPGWGCWTADSETDERFCVPPTCD